MKPLVVLIGSFLIAEFVLFLLNGTPQHAFSARIAMSIMLVFTSIGHFAYTKGMTMMLPKFIPFKKELIYSTAFFEILGAIGLHLLQVKTITAWLLILFFILILPANIYAAKNKLNYQTANFDGQGLTYLWFRIPLQLVFIFWVYFSAIQF